MIKVTGLNKAFGALRAVSDLSFEADRHHTPPRVGTLTTAMVSSLDR